MTYHLLKSTTSLVLCATLAAGPLAAQDDAGPYPCIAPGNVPVENRREMIAALGAALTDGVEGPVAGAEACTAPAFRRALRYADTALLTAIANADEERMATVFTLADETPIDVARFLSEGSEDAPEVVENALPQVEEGTEAADGTDLLVEGDAPAGEPLPQVTEEAARTETTEDTDGAAEETAEDMTETADSDVTEPVEEVETDNTETATDVTEPVEEVQTDTDTGEVDLTEPAEEIETGTADDGGDVTEPVEEVETDVADTETDVSEPVEEINTAGDGEEVVVTEPVTELDDGTDVNAPVETTEVDEDTADEPVVAEEEIVSEASEETPVEDETVESETETPAEETVEAPQVERAPAPTAAAAADDDESEPALGDVVTEELTEEDVRSSDQDFETSASGENRETEGEAVEEAEEREEGLSPFQQALLLGLGAAVVGSVLDNGDEVISNTGDRVVIKRGDELRVLKDDDVLLRQPGAQIATRTFDDGSTRTTVTYRDGTEIVTIRSAEGVVLRRVRIAPDGERIVLFDDTEVSAPVEVSTLPEPVAAPEVQFSDTDGEALRAALQAALARDAGRTFSLFQIRQIEQVRDLAPLVELDTITFATGSAAIPSSQAEALITLGRAISDVIEDDPRTIILIEGHTDTVGDAGYNLALSDRRAETVALALTEYFDVPPANLITQGYGESDLKIPLEGDIRENRRAAVRNITGLLR